MTSNQKQILHDAIKVLGDLAATAATGGAAAPVLVNDVPTAKDALERIVLELPVVDAPSLDPVDRAEADAASQADEDAQFPEKS